MSEARITNYKRTSNDFPLPNNVHPEPGSGTNGYSNGNYGSAAIPLDHLKNVSELDDIPAKPRNKDGAGSSSSGSDAGSDASEKVPEVKMVGMAEMFRFADAKDKLLVVFGIIFATLQGAAMPLMIIVFGGMSDLFIYDGMYENFVNENWYWLDDETNSTQQEALDDPEIVMDILDGNENYTDELALMEEYLVDDFLQQMQRYAVYYTIIGVAVMVLAYAQLVCWQISSYRQCQRIRTQMFASILKQEIGWFDTHESGELNTRLSDDIQKIQDGIGDKLGSFFQYFATFIAGFIVGFIYGWQLTLVIISVSPLLAISGAIMAKAGAALTSNQELI